MFRKSVLHMDDFLGFYLPNCLALPATCFCSNCHFTWQLRSLTVIGHPLEGTHAHLSKLGKMLVPSMGCSWASPQSTSRCCTMNIYRGCSSAAQSADGEFPSRCSLCIACSLPAHKPSGSLTQGRAGGKERTADQKEPMIFMAGGGRSWVALGQEKRRQSSNSFPSSQGFLHGFSLLILSSSWATGL